MRPERVQKGPMQVMAKEIKGKVTDDKSTEMEGKAQQAAGKIKDTADDVADELRDRSHARDRH